MLHFIIKNTRCLKKFGCWLRFLTLHTSHRDTSKYFFTEDFVDFFTPRYLRRRVENIVYPYCWKHFHIIFCTFWLYLHFFERKSVLKFLPQKNYSVLEHQQFPRRNSYNEITQPVIFRNKKKQKFYLTSFWKYSRK